ncbi:indole-3-glycerol phosphate synthase TrpC [Desertivirga brevis]|uniref:indole-3-glycerol phosphate synthase TrpC n=1 Tax=Desertivirga brevis TaxID=2810310 RepID=UPI001A95E017|nr:indole-3-glycerol phosphate synthase TrpC [Pedobacter sp. SYSU D00873]
MNILSVIVTNTRIELARRKAQTPYKALEFYPLYDRNPLPAIDFIFDRKRHGIISEIKKQSPSKGVINNSVNVVEVAKGYERAGASAISVLTENKYFGGQIEDLIAVKCAVNIPVLRKDFIIDEYQVVEAKAIGADIVLLIASVLAPNEIENLARFAKSLGLSVLLEVHDLRELKRSLNPYIDLVGVNNRNLKTFDVSIGRSLDLAPHIPMDFVKVSESGLSDPLVISELKSAGYEGFLIGESFMKHADPAAALETYIQQISRKERLNALLAS